MTNVVMYHMTFDQLQKTIGIQFKDVGLLKQAFVHRSYLNEARHTKTSNERLEFLGDAVLSFLTSDYLYTTYPDYPEGTLTNIRSTLVKTPSLARAAKDLRLGELLLLSKGEEDSGGRENASLLADVFEALLGAISIDQGVEKARVFLGANLFPYTAAVVSSKGYIDFKSFLQEIIQEKSRISPTYHVIKSEGPDHSKIFWVEAVVGDKAIGRGTGKSKQAAEQDAAQKILEKMGRI